MLYTHIYSEIYTYKYVSLYIENIHRKNTYIHTNIFIYTDIYTYIYTKQEESMRCVVVAQGWNS